MSRRTPLWQQAHVLTGVLCSALAVAAYCAHDPGLWYGMIAAVTLSGGLLARLYVLDRISSRTVLILAVLLRLCFFPLLPVLSDDAYRYVWDGMLYWEGINPYRYTPETLTAFQDAPLYEALNSKAFYSIYPPLSQVTFALGGWFYDFGWSVSYYVIKALVIGAELVALALLYRMVSARSLMLFAWNPVVLLELAGQGHTEGLMLPWLVLMVRAVRDHRPYLAGFAIALAGWVKLFPFILIPFLWQRLGWRAVVAATACGVGGLAPYYFPGLFSNIAESLNLYVRYFEFNAGLYYALKEIYWIVEGSDWSKILGPNMRILYLVFVGALFVYNIRAKYSIEKIGLLVFGGFLLFSTTVHPWYPIGVLLFVCMTAKPVWHWYAFSIGAVGTYSLYVDGPYWTFVVFSWIAFIVLYSTAKAATLFQQTQQWRGQLKARRIYPLLEGAQILDLGCGEGYIGLALTHKDKQVVLADVINLNRTDLPHVVYDGTTLSFAGDAFDTVVLYFVLHHCQEPDRVLAEALRVARKRVVVVESIYTNRWDYWLLDRLDRLANRMRSGGLMNPQEAFLSFRKAEEWVQLARSLGGMPVYQRRYGHVIHKQFVLAIDL